MERHEAVIATADLCRDVDMSSATADVLLAGLRGLGRSKSTVYRALAELADAADALTNAAEADDAAALRQMHRILAADAAIRIAFVALTTTEIEALAEDAAERCKASSDALAAPPGAA